MAASTTTVLDGLRKEFSNIAQLKLSPDAQQHAKFLDGMMTAIQQYIAHAAQSTIGSGGGPGAAASGGVPGSPVGASGAPGAPSPGGMTPGQAGAPGGMAPPMGVAPGGGAGMSGLSQAGNMDEIRRMLNPQGVNP